MKLGLNNPVQVDSSDYVMYPLLLTDEEYETDDSYGKSSSRSYTYWNMAFYNTATGESHLLDENRKMVIYQYDQKSSEYTAIDEIKTHSSNIFANKLIYYTVTTLDFNHNGILDTRDPAYLFISGKDGKNFKQISPEKGNLKDWQIVEKTNKVLMMVSFDSNKDKKFDEDDLAIPMVYDLNSNTVSKEVFDAKFILKVKNSMNKKWPTKENHH